MTAALDTDAGDSSTTSADIGQYTEAVGNEISRFYAEEGTRRQAMADDPCRFAVDIRQYWTDTGRPLLTRAEANAIVIAEAGHRSVLLAKDRWGRPSSQYGGVPSFAEFIIANDLVEPPPPFLMLFLPALAALIATSAGFLDFVNDKLPPNPPPLGTRSGANKGLQVGPGVYLYASGKTTDGDHLRYGKLRGNGIRDGWNAWMDVVRAQAYPARFPNWREQLTRLTGSPRSDWRHWQAGEAYQSGSRIAAIQSMLADVQTWLRDADTACDQQRARGGGNGRGTPPVLNGGGPPEETGPSPMIFLLLLVALFFLKKRKR